MARILAFFKDESNLFFSAMVFLFVAVLSGTSKSDELPATCEAVTYAPVYSDIYSGGRAQNVRLAATLSVRNVSPDAPVTLTAVSYHNTEGAVLHKSVDGPLELKPLETRDFTIDVVDLAGGSGANFLINWQAAHTTPAPLIETVMLGGLGTKGFAFASRARTISDSCGRVKFE